MLPAHAAPLSAQTGMLSEFVRDRSRDGADLDALDAARESTESSCAATRSGFGPTNQGGYSR